MFFYLVIEVFLILQHAPPPRCDYKVWIDPVRGLEAISYLCSMAHLNMMEEEFHTHRMEECKHAAYFSMRREMDRE
jgi:hypothetical protein